MKLSKLHKLLRREAAAHPGKAAVLAVLFVVALWFWAPLVWRWTRPDDAAAAPPVAQGPDSAAAAVPAPGAGASPPKARDSGPTWRQLAQWMDDDPRTMPTNPLRGRRDPFLVIETQPAKSGVAEEQEQQKEVESPPPQRTPQDLGMVLSGTIIGPNRRVAQINGRPYRQGDIVRLVQEGHPIEFTLAAVHPQRIVLQRDDEQFELAIPVPAASGRIELSAQRD